MSEENITTGEVVRRMNRLENASVDAELFRQAIKEIDRRLGSIEDNQKAMFRMVGAAFIGILVEGVILAVSRGGV